MGAFSADFAAQLKAALESFDARISALEKTVNETIVGGLKEAAAEYDDDCKFSDFCDKHSEKWSKFEAPMKVLYGEDYDLPSSIYEVVKETEGYGTEGFDEDSTVDEILSAIDEKIRALQDLKEEVVEEKQEEESPSEEKEEKKAIESEEEEEEEIPSEEQLAEEFRKAKLD